MLAARAEVRAAGTAAVSPKLALNAGAVRPDRLASHAASGARQPVPGIPGEGQCLDETKAWKASHHFWIRRREASS